MHQVVITRLQPYLVILVLNPTQKAIFDEAAVPTIIAGPHAVMAETEVQASAKAMRFMPEEMKGKEDQVEVSILPFRRSTS